jgi:hypothetical protein
MQEPSERHEVDVIFSPPQVTASFTDELQAIPENTQDPKNEGQNSKNEQYENIPPGVEETAGPLAAKKGKPQDNRSVATKTPDPLGYTSSERRLERVEEKGYDPPPLAPHPDQFPDSKEHRNPAAAPANEGSLFANPPVGVITRSEGAAVLHAATSPVVEKVNVLPPPVSPPSTDLKSQRDAYERNWKIGLSALYWSTIIGSGVAAFFFWPVILPLAATFIVSVLSVYAAYYVGFALLTLLGAATSAAVFVAPLIAIHKFLPKWFADRKYTIMPPTEPEPKRTLLDEAEVFDENTNSEIGNQAPSKILTTPGNSYTKLLPETTDTSYIVEDKRTKEKRPYPLSRILSSFTSLSPKPPSQKKAPETEPNIHYMGDDDDNANLSTAAPTAVR